MLTMLDLSISAESCTHARALDVEIMKYKAVTTTGTTTELMDNISIMLVPE